MLSKFAFIPVLRGFTEIADLWEAVGEYGGLICGGYVRYMCSPRQEPVPAGDVDIYFETMDQFVEMKRFLKRLGFEEKHENDVSLTFRRPARSSDDYNNLPPRWRVCPVPQLIKPLNQGAIVATGDLQTILDNFDFTVVRVGLTSPDTALADEDFLEDEAKRVLRIRNIHCPVSSSSRLCKYGRKGYYATPSQIFKLFLDWDSREEDYKMEIAQLFQESELGNLTEAQVDRLEALLRID